MSRAQWKIALFPLAIALSHVSIDHQQPSNEKEEDTVMSNHNSSIGNALVTLHIPKNIPDLILYANNIVQRLTNNPNFPSPSPTVAALRAAINDLHAAEPAAL